MSSVFLDVCADPFAMHLPVERAGEPATTLSLGVFCFLLICFAVLCSALAGILSAEIYDILVGNVHLSYRIVGIALSRHREHRNQVPTQLCCSCNAYLWPDLTVLSALRVDENLFYCLATNRRSYRRPFRCGRCTLFYG